jgi:small-conductance mechanosensitive channel
MPLGGVTHIVTRGAFILPEDEIHEEDGNDDEENTADMEDALSDGLADNLRDVLGDNPCEPEPTIQSEIASIRKMLEEQREMFNNAIQQNTQLCVQNSELMEANREYRRQLIRPEAKKMKNFDRAHPQRYCG